MARELDTKCIEERFGMLIVMKERCWQGRLQLIIVTSSWLWHTSCGT